MNNLNPQTRRHAKLTGKLNNGKVDDFKFVEDPFTISKEITVSELVSDRKITKQLEEIESNFFAAMSDGLVDNIRILDKLVNK